MIIKWSTLYAVTLLLCMTWRTGCAKKKNRIIDPNLVPEIITSAITGQRASGGANDKKSAISGVHLKEATDAINKLVDESIVDRVQEAEKEVSHMLLKSIESHIQEAGKVLLKEDEVTCKDKLSHCKELKKAGVCETSKDAMVVHCPNTCKFCDLVQKGKKAQNEDEENDSDLEKLQTAAQRVFPTKKKTRKHKKVVVKAKHLSPTETQAIHQKMLEATKDGSSLPSQAPFNPLQQLPNLYGGMPINGFQQPLSPTAPFNVPSTQRHDTLNKEYGLETNESPETTVVHKLRNKAHKKHHHHRRHHHFHKEGEKPVNIYDLGKVKLEEYLKEECHPLCVEDCISSCAPGCCKKKAVVKKTNKKPKKRCAPACAK